jgi:hypothetical protein
MGLKQMAGLVLGALSFWTCSQSSKKEDATVGLSYRAGEVKKEHFGGCDTITNKGVSVIIDLWEPSDSGAVATKIREILTKKTIQRLNSYGDPASVVARLEANKSPRDAFEVFERTIVISKRTFPMRRAVGR